MATGRMRMSMSSLLLAVLLATVLAREESDARLEAEKLFESEGGRFDVWRSDQNDMLKNVGMEAGRIQLRERGLLLPKYTDSSLLIYCTRGSAMMGMSLPMGARRDYRIIRKGQVVAVPRGMVYWFYNAGERGEAGRRHDNSRREEKREREHEGERRRREHEREREHEHRRKHHEDREEELGGECHLIAISDTSLSAVERGRCTSFMLAGGRTEECGGVMQGFSKDMLAQAWDMDEQTVERLVTSQKETGIIRVDQDHPFHDLMCRKCRSANGETGGSFESMSMMHFMYDLESANCDHYSSNGGCMTVLNRYRLPVLKTLRPDTGMGAIRTHLESEAMVAPGYMANAHTMVYCSRGSARVQVLKPNGERCYDEELQEGQMMMIPMGYPTIKRAGREGCHLMAFTTSDMPMMMHMAGEDSVLWNMPRELLMAAFDVDEEPVAELMKRSTRHAAILPPTRQERERKHYA